MSAPAGGRRWLPPALWTAVVLVSSSWPNPDVDDVPAGSDKVTHLLLYAVLGALVARAWPALVARGRRLPATALALAAFAAVDEWHQRFVPGRSASAGDWVADAVGAALGLLAVAVLRRGAPVRAS